MLNAISLFSSSGIGDLGLRNNDINVVVSNEIDKERSKLYKRNYPNSKMFNGDIWKLKNSIIDYYKNNYHTHPFILLATPPCQGMSLAGMGKMLNDYRKGNNPKLNPKFDARNRLIIPAIEIAKVLKPQWIILENVPNMKNTLFYDENGNLIKIIDYIFNSLSDYIGNYEVVNVADYGVPQDRKRLITILTKKNNKSLSYLKNNLSFIPFPTHSKDGSIGKKWLTVRDAIGNLPKLDGKKGFSSDLKYNKFHFVPVLDDKKYFWISHTPEGKSAFDNQCINPNCMYQHNPTHGSLKNKVGITQSKKDTPLFCIKCGKMLPRPYVEKNGKYRLMKGYISAYKRIWWDKPASTITTRFQFVSSDNNVHPSQNRTLSIYEALILQTINKYNYNWDIDNKIVKIGLIRDSIGESVPPLLIDKIVRHIIKVQDKINY